MWHRQAEPGTVHVTDMWCCRLSDGMFRFLSLWGSAEEVWRVATRSFRILCVLYFVCCVQPVTDIRCICHRACFMMIHKSRMYSMSLRTDSRRMSGVGA